MKNQLKVIPLKSLKFLLFFFLLFSGVNWAFAGQWAKVINNVFTEKPYSIKQTDDDGYIIVGYYAAWIQSNLWVVKLDKNGEIQWQKSYSGNYDEEARSVQQTQDGGYIVAGYISDGENEDMWILKLNKDGDIQWQKTYGGIGNERAKSIQRTKDRGYIVAGYTSSFGAGEYDLWIIKLNSNGNIQWQKTYGGSSYDLGNSIQQTNDDGYIVVGSTRSFGNGDADALVLKLDKNGQVQWANTYGGTLFDGAFSIWQTLDNGYIIGGNTWSFKGDRSEIWIIKIDQYGEIQWQKTYSNGSFDYIGSIQQTIDGGYIVAGTDFLFGTNKSNIQIFKLDESGDIQWQKIYGGERWSEAHFIQQTHDGGYVVAAWTTLFSGELFDTTGEDFWILKLDKSGSIPSCSYEKGSDISVNNTDVIPVNISISVFDTDIEPTDTNRKSSIPPLVESSTACFYNPPKYRLIVRKTGTGKGTITSTPKGIDCGKHCSYEYDENSNVNLTATSDFDATFTGWSGYCSSCGKNTTCIIEMDSEKTCIANFEETFIPVAVFEPGTLDFGSYEIGEDSDSLKVKIYNRGNGKLIIYSVEITGKDKDDFEIEKDKCSNKTLKKKKKCEVKIKLKTSEIGNKEAFLDVKTNAKNLSIPMNAYVSPIPPGEIEVNPLLIDFGDYGIGYTSKKSKIKVKNISNDKTKKLLIFNVKIDGVDKGQFGIYKDKCSDKILKKGKSCDIQIVFKPNSTGDKMAVLVIESNDEDELEVIVDLTGNGKDGDIFIEDKNYNFGNVEVGDDKKKKFKIKNKGLGYLTINSVQLTGVDKNQFIIDKDKCTGKKLKKGKSCEIKVKFIPTSSGSKQSIIQINSDDLENKQTEIQIEGVGI